MALSEQQKQFLAEQTSESRAEEFSLYIDDVWLSEMELLVLWLKQDGECSNSEIAEGLDISPGDPAKYLSRIREKLEKSEQTVQEIDERVL